MINKLIIGLLALCLLQCLTNAEMIQDEILVRNDLNKLFGKF